MICYYALNKYINPFDKHNIFEYFNIVLKVCSKKYHNEKLQTNLLISNNHMDISSKVNPFSKSNLLNTVILDSDGVTYCIG